MAYAFEVSTPTIGQINGRRHVSFVVTETEVGTSDEWNIPLGDPFWTLTLFEAELTDAGLATEIDPDLGLAESFVVGTLNEVATNTTAGTHVRTQDDVRFTGGTLYGRSKPDDTADEIRTRVTLAIGHKP